MVPELLVTALILGWILKGRVGRLADVKIKYGWMIFLPLALYFASYAANFAQVFPRHSPIFAVVHVVEFLIFMVVAVANRRIPGVNLVYVGLAINLVAILANGGFMPVAKEAVAMVVEPEDLQEALRSPAIEHTLINAGTRFSFLCDIVAARKPFVFAPSVYSIGDLVMSLGAFIAIVAIMCNPKYSERGSLQKA